MKLKPHIRLLPFSAVIALLMQGCVAQHGVDFGHWALVAERRDLVRANVAPLAVLPQHATIAVLPTLGKMTEETATRLRTQLCVNLQDHAPLNLIITTADTTESPLLQADNLLEIGGSPRLSEIAGAARVFDASHVICISVTDYSPYPPQKVYFTAWLIKAADASLVATMAASLDASEQQTVMALADFLQSRRARPYDDTHLDIMLQSPAEFMDFVCAYSARHIVQDLMRAGLIKDAAAQEVPSKEKVNK
jgi:hypothetical protein